MQDLTQEQQSALNLDGQRCCLIAGPGSGKTHTMVARIHRDAATTSPATMVVVTFTNAAAAELRERLHRTGIHPEHFRHIGTLHSWAAKTLWAAGDDRKIATDRQIKDATQWVKKTLGAMARNMTAPQIWRAAVDPPLHGSDRNVGLALRNRLQAEGLTHHDLVLGDFRNLIHMDRVPAPARIYVDEYQDSAPVDAQIYHAMHQRGSALYFIGDPRQAIYGFRGATPDNLARAWADADAKAQLTANFRSRPQICHLVTSIARRMPPATFDPTVEPVDQMPGFVWKHQINSEQEELVAVADWAVVQVEKRRTAAVLVRYNSQARAVAAILRSRGILTTCSADRPADEPGQTIDEAIQRLQAARAIEATPAGWQRAMTTLGISMANQDALLPRLKAIASPDDMISLAEPCDSESATLQASDALVAVATIHAAKGLEWDAVWLLGADSLAFPDLNHEAGRLVFVACSRAREHLTISHALTRTQPESGNFLSGLAPTGWI